MSQLAMKQKRNRLAIGRLVASSNPLRNIIGKRLDVIVKYNIGIFSNRVVSQEVIGIRTDY